MTTLHIVPSTPARDPLAAASIVSKLWDGTFTPEDREQLERLGCMFCRTCYAYLMRHHVCCWTAEVSAPLHPGTGQ
jgi:hypothetical protein